MDQHHSDILIVGAGIFGTSTAYHLSKQQPRRSVTVIDRTPFPPKHAASTDITKIIRNDYTQRFYMDLATEALEAWRTWPELKQFHHQTGWLHLGEKGDDTAPRIRQNFKDRGHDVTEDVPMEQVKSRFGGILQHSDLSHFDNAYWNPDAGWCDAGMATAEMMKVAVDNGVRYVTADVDHLLYNGDRLRGLQTKGGQTYTAEKIVLACGAWTSAIMASTEDELSIPENESVETQVKATAVCVAHYKMQADDLQQLKQMPVIIWGELGDAQPPPSVNLLKYTNGNSVYNTTVTRSGRKISAPPDRDQHVVSGKLKQDTWEVITGKCLPQFTQRPAEYFRLCWDAVTPSQNHLICQHPHPALSNLYIATGGSLHSYKFLPNIGKYVVKVVDGESNGKESDARWAWKQTAVEGRGAHEKAYPQRELSALDD